MSKKQIINILLLGQTGTGKSTLINSIANYFTYLSFDEALAANEPQCLIPTRFSITLPTMEDVIITLNGMNRFDQNERHGSSAMSCTHDPRVYELCGANVEYHIIDVPGIGDTGGIKEDQRNKMAILQKLKEFKVLHGIFIVLNSTGPRLTPEIKNNYNEILMELHKNATPNIMFVITNSSGSNYLPGTAMEPLKTYVAELAQNGINLTLDNQSVFCLDNEGFRYQCGMRNDKFKAEFQPLEQHFRQSWTKSREVIFRLFNAILFVQGHTVAESTSISEARIMIQALMGPLAKVYTIIEKEMSKSVKESQIRSLMETGNLMEKVTTIEKFEYPQCVCLSCAKKIKIPGSDELQIDFKQICHKRCDLPNTVPDKFPEPKLIDCAAFDHQGICRKCGCHYLKHVRITSKTLQKILEKPKAAILSRQKAEEIYATLLSTLQYEQAFVWDTVIQLAKYLQNNAIVDFNPLFMDKLKIEIEKQQLSCGSSDVVDKLKRRLEQFETQMNMVEVALQKMHISETSEINIQQILGKLYSLQIHGSVVKKFFEAEISTSSNVKHSNNVRFNALFMPSV